MILLSYNLPQGERALLLPKLKWILLTLENLTKLNINNQLITHSTSLIKSTLSSPHIFSAVFTAGDSTSCSKTLLSACPPQGCEGILEEYTPLLMDECFL